MIRCLRGFVAVLLAAPLWVPTPATAATSYLRIDPKGGRIKGVAGAITGWSGYVGDQMSLTRDGRYLVMQVEIDGYMTEPDDDGNRLPGAVVVMFDRIRRTYSLVTKSYNGKLPKYAYYEVGLRAPNMSPVVSANGRYIAYQSGALDIVRTTPRKPSSLAPFFYVYDVVRQRTTLVPTLWNSPALSVSNDGKWLITAELIATLNPNDLWNPGPRSWGSLVRVNTRTGALERAQLDASNVERRCTGTGVPRAAASADGRYVAFECHMTVVAEPPKEVTDATGPTWPRRVKKLFVRDLDRRTTTQIASTLPSSALPDAIGDSTTDSSLALVGMDDSGTTVSLREFDDTKSVTWLHNLRTGARVKVLETAVLDTATAYPARPPSYFTMTGDGRTLLYSTIQGTTPPLVEYVIGAYSVRDGRTRTVVPAGADVVEVPSVSGDGRVVLLNTRRAFVQDDTNNEQDTYVQVTS